MKKIIILFIFFFILSVNVSGQKKAGFSGVWRLDKANSKMSPEENAIRSITKIIKQNAKDIVIKTVIKIDPGHKFAVTIEPDKSLPTEQVEIYKLDGSETDLTPKNPLIQAVSTYGKVIIRNNETLEIVKNTKIGNPLQNIAYLTVETWKLSSTGKILKITQTVKTPENSREFIEWVFNKEDRPAKKIKGAKESR